MQKSNENVHMYIIKYANLHQTVTGKRPEQETYQSHLTKFLTSINNVEISREICRQGIPQGPTLQDLFLEVTEKEAGQQLAEGVVLACSAQIMEIQDMDYEINELGGDKLRRDVEDYSVGSVEGLIIYKVTVKQVVMMMMINQMDLTKKLVICIILL